MIEVDGLFVRPGDLAWLAEYWVVVDKNGKVLGIAKDEREAQATALRLKAGVQSPIDRRLK